MKFQRYWVLFTYTFLSVFFHIQAADFNDHSSEMSFENIIRVYDDDDDEDDMCGLCNLTDSEAKSKKPRRAKHKYEFAIGAVIQNEARFIKEWIEYYKINGVQHFYIYDNRSTDNIQEVLAPYIAKGEVELIYWDVDANDAPEYIAMQVNAYKEILKRSRGNVKWLGFLDIDEYVVTNVDDTLIQFLRRFEPSNVCGGICYIWVFFGTSDVPRKPDDKLLIEVLLENGGRTCEGDKWTAWKMGSYKSIAMVDRVEDLGSAHYFLYKKGYSHEMAPFEQGQINHYWAGDVEYFENVKIPRRAVWGQPPSSTRDWERGMHNINDFSYKILRFVPELRKRMGMD